MTLLVSSRTTGDIERESESTQTVRTGALRGEKHDLDSAWSVVVRGSSRLFVGAPLAVTTFPSRSLLVGPPQLRPHTAE